MQQADTAHVQMADAAHELLAMSSTTPAELWLQRVSSVQQERATPEVLSRLRAQAEVDKRVALTAKKAKRMSKSMSLSSAAFHAGVRSADATPNRASTSVNAMDMLASPQFLSPSFRSSAVKRTRTIEEEEAEEEALEQELDVLADEQVAHGALAVADLQALAHADADPGVQQAQQASQLAETLKQLEVEPSDAEACAAKFALYEGFAKLTEDARTAVTELATSSQAELATSADASASVVATLIAADLRGIDKPQNLGLADDPRGRWFVHGMCDAAVNNQRLLDGVLGGIQRKLELLASQTDCPICFECFEPTTRPATALSCAHKVCTECWGHWCAMGNGHVAVCPLCRHEEFLERVMRAARRVADVQPRPMDDDL